MNEKAFDAGLSSWQKPLSCHLFPIRVHRMGREFLRYTEIEECAGGRRRGREDNIALVEFLREPLIRHYGEAWYNEFLAACTAT